MKPHANTQPVPYVEEEQPSLLARLKGKLAAVLEKFAPVGYQDEAGFHYGSEKTPRNPKAKLD